MSCPIIKNQRILVVDDEEHIRKIVRFQLEKSGYEVETAEDGIEALKAVEACPPDLILLDLMMPNMDGYEVCKRLKSDYQTNHIPVIMVTAKADLENKLQGFEDGANDYIAKPFAITELLVRVRNVLQWSQLQRQANPLTGLPGNISIERELERRLEGEGRFVFMYADIDNFKPFNDYYGYRRGDDAIRLTAEILVEAVKRFGDGDDFIGHVGGDDFVMITTPEKCDIIASSVVRIFDEKIAKLFAKEDIDRGYIEVVNRKGTVDRFPLLTVTIAVVSDGDGKMDHIARISDIASELKRYGKRLEGSVVVKERRKDGTSIPVGGLERITDDNVDPRIYPYQWLTTYILLAAAALFSLNGIAGASPLNYLFSVILVFTAVISHALFGRLKAEVKDLKSDLARVQADKDAKFDDIVRLYQSSQATSHEAEPGGIMDAVAEDARRLVNCDSASVAIFIEKDLLASVTKGISNEFKRNLRWRVRKGGMTDLVLSSGEPLLIGDAASDPRSRESSAVKIGGQHSIMAVPLMVEDETFGIMYAGDKEEDKFSERDLMLFTILANNAAASIKQARLQRELEKKLKELELAHKELIGADRLKAEFISTVTSQMRVPLDAIRTYSQTVLQRMDDTTFKLKEKFLGAVVDESAKLLNTVNGVIDLSRMEFGEGDLRKEAVNISEVLKDVCGVLDPVCIDKEVEIMIEAPGQVSSAHLDRDMIFLMYRNLLEAAISSAKAASPVRIVIDEDDSFLTTRVSLVPSREVMEMEKAVQAISTRDAVPSDAGSLGLTLQVAKNIVFRHGGRIWAETHDPACWSLVVLFGKEKKAIMPSDLMLEIMTSRPELRRMLSLVTDMISKVIEVGRCELLLEDSATGNLVAGASQVNEGGDSARLVSMPAGGLSGKVYEEGRPVVLNSEMDLADSGIKETLPFERVPCASVPIRLKGEVVGVLTVADKQGSHEFFNEDDLGLLAAMGDRIGVAIERATSYESARDQFVSAMVAMKSVMEARSIPAGKSMGHAALVAGLARSMGVDDEEVQLLQYVSRIYDVGMVKVGEGILRKRGGLRVGEYESVKRHPEEGVDIVGPIEFLEQVKEVILHHHERFDGGGYPGGLSGEGIPVGARILAVVDSYSSMLSDRPYRPALSVEEAIEELRRCRGTQFDPSVVDRFIGLLGRSGVEVRPKEKI